MAITLANDLMSFRRLKIGAGGYCTGIDIAPNGVMVTHNDTHGAHRWNPSTNEWDQMFTSLSVPLAYRVPDSITGADGIAVAYSNTARMSALMKGIPFYSTDSGASWTAATGFTAATNGANAFPTKLYSRKVAIDPTNPDVRYVATYNLGVWQSLDGGVTYTQCAGVPTTGVACNIIIDPSSATSGSPSRKQTIWCFITNAGFYRSTDGGATWAAVAGGPTTCYSTDITTAGILYATGVRASPAATGLFKYSGGAWAVAQSGIPAWGVAIDPADESRIIVVTDSGKGYEVTGAGATISALRQFSRTAPNMPWHAFTNEFYMSAAQIRFHPTVPNQVWFVQGLGAWKAALPPGFTAIEWVEHSVGIEQIVVQKVWKHPTNGRVFKVGWDRGMFLNKNPEGFAVDHEFHSNTAWSINHGWDVDCARDNPNFLVALSQFVSKFSTDGGDTWSPIPSYPRDVPMNSLRYTLANNLSTVAGSPTVTATGHFNGASVGNWFFFDPPVSIGGLTLTGPYQVASNPSNGVVTFNAGSNAASTVNNGGGTTSSCWGANLNDVLSTVSGSPVVTVAWPNHGMGGGSRVIFKAPVTIGGITLTGTYPIGSVGANSFTITHGSNATSTVSNGGGRIVLTDEWCANGYIPNMTRICVLTATNWIMSLAAGRGIYYTTNGGVSWTKCSFPGNPVEGGFLFGTFHMREVVCKDPSTNNKAFAYNSYGGVYRTTDGGATWTLRYSYASSGALVSSDWNTKIKPVPGRPGHLFISSGEVGSVIGSNVMKFSGDEGLTWTQLGTGGELTEVYDFAFGPVKDGSTYPTLWLAGWLNGTTWGYWYSTDFDPTVSLVNFTLNKVADFPGGCLDQLRSLATNPQNWKAVYLGFGGSGCWYADSNYLDQTWDLQTL